MITRVAETGSTNADLLLRLRSGDRVGEGDWLVADRQRSGRGRRGREWFDGAGNFMGSTLVRLGPRDPAPPTLALIAGLAVYEAVLPLLAEPANLLLKWPNDLMLGRAKLAGILLEREGDAIVIGVGVNLASAPEIAERDTIALGNLGPTPDRDVFADALAARFDAELDRWRTYGVEPAIRRWDSAAHPHGTPLTVVPPGEVPVTGAYAGLREDGSLTLRLVDGRSRVIHAGDVMLASQGN